MNYLNQQAYYNITRELLQDQIPPFRYTDQTIVNSLNHALFEISRIRPDVFIDIKYQIPITKGPLNDGVPGFYIVSGIVTPTPGVPEPGNTNSPLVPIPSSLFMAVCWYCSSYVQFLDVDDTQDVRSQSFSAKFTGSLLQLAA
jgi:hypothetical protein